MPKPGLCTYVRGLGGQYCPSVNGYKVGIYGHTGSMMQDTVSLGGKGHKIA